MVRLWVASAFLVAVMALGLSEHKKEHEKPDVDDKDDDDVTETETSTATRTATTSTETTTTATTTTATTTTRTTTTVTTTTETFTTSTTSTSTSTTGPHMVGGALTEEAFRGWLSIWRSKYQDGLWHAGVDDPWESLMPKALKGVPTTLVLSEGGVASGIVTEGMGYGLMIEGFQAAGGSKEALKHGLALMKSWLGLVNGPGPLVHPFAGGGNFTGSSWKVDFWPYGSSVIFSHHSKLIASGVPAWKFPIKEDELDDYLGSAADGDQDAIMGMIYLAAALQYPADFVDVVLRSVIAFASADLGFPDLYRTLPDGQKVFVPKLGSMWGGLLPPGGKYKTKQEPWCYSPGYFAPAHYRAFRDFVKAHWRPAYDEFLPKHMDGSRSSLRELVEAFDGAVIAGYNILYYSSCNSGSVSNWVGVEAACAHNDTLHCPGVPWAHTPYVGEWGGQCAQSATDFGSFGPDASRTAWRIALDYKLYREESAGVRIYDREGKLDNSVTFGARVYLNRIVIQYKTYAHCDGGEPGDCMKWSPSPYELAYAFDPKVHAPDVNCTNVPNRGESWWAGFMAYPTFAAFVAPYDEIGQVQMTQWMDTLVSICNFSDVNFTDYESGGKPRGKICLDSYFEASQAVIATMVMAGKVPELRGILKKGVSEAVAIQLKEQVITDGGGALAGFSSSGLLPAEARRPLPWLAALAACAGLAAAAVGLRAHVHDRRARALGRGEAMPAGSRTRSNSASYFPMVEERERCLGPDAEAEAEGEA